MFRFTQIQFGYGAHTLLNNSDIAIAPGQLMLLRGVNGSGKTTLMKIMAGLLKPSSCQVDIADKSGSWKSLRKLILQQNCYLHQSPYMFAGSVLHNVKIMAANKTESEYMQALSLVGIEHLAGHQADTLSGGERQRLAMARAYLHQPALLLLDEPLANMDSNMVQRTLELINTFKQTGTAVILCSHMHDDIDNIADLHLSLADGKLQPY